MHRSETWNGLASRWNADLKSASNGLPGKSLVILRRAPTKFIGEWVETHVKHKLEAAWQSVGQNAKAVKIEVKARQAR